MRTTAERYAPGGSRCCATAPPGTGTTNARSPRYTPSVVIERSPGAMMSCTSSDVGARPRAASSKSSEAISRFVSRVRLNVRKPFPAAATRSSGVAGEWSTDTSAKDASAPLSTPSSTWNDFVSPLGPSCSTNRHSWVVHSSARSIVACGSVWFHPPFSVERTSVTHAFPRPRAVRPTATRSPHAPGRLAAVITAAPSVPRTSLTHSARVPFASPPATPTVGCGRYPFHAWNVHPLGSPFLPISEVKSPYTSNSAACAAVQAAARRMKNRFFIEWPIEVMRGEKAA